MKNWKKVSAAIVAAGLITTSAGQVWANETGTEDKEAVEQVSAEKLQEIASIVPTGYTANNIFALSSNLEKISNPKAKTALQKNIDKALAKWEAKQAELPAVEVPTEDDATDTDATDTTDTTDTTNATDTDGTETTEVTEVTEAVEAPETTEVTEAVEAPETTEVTEAVEAPEAPEVVVTEAPEVKVENTQKTAALAKAAEKKAAGLAVAAKNIEKNAVKKEATQVKVEEKKAAAKEKSAKKDTK